MIRFNLPDIRIPMNDLKRDVNRIREYLVTLENELSYQLDYVDEINLTPSLADRINGSANDIKWIKERIEGMEASLRDLRDRVEVLEGN